MSKLVDGILDLLFPPKCVFCRGILRRGESGVCARCRDSLPYRERPRTPGPDGVNAVCAPFRYAGDVSEALKRYKFKGMTAYASVFGRLVAQCVRDNLAGEYDIVSWVPLSSERLAERGYDQAMLIAMAAALELDDVAVETLRKTRNAAPQSLTGGRAERLVNISGAYEAIDPELVHGKRVLLIDDIITSGATVAECARTLRRAGAAGVVCASVAASAD